MYLLETAFHISNFLHISPFCSSLRFFIRFLVVCTFHSLVLNDLASSIKLGEFNIVDPCFQKPIVARLSANFLSCSFVFYPTTLVTSSLLHLLMVNCSKMQNLKNISKLALTKGILQSVR